MHRTPADRFRRERVVDAMSGNAAGDVDARTLANIIKVLAPRWFVLRNAHQTSGTLLLQSRTTLCWLKGPMTRGDLKRMAGDAAEAHVRRVPNDDAY